jgi:hypothetical protein
MGAQYPVFKISIFGVMPHGDQISDESYLTQFSTDCLETL